MKKLAIIAVLASLSAPAYADDIYGTWRTIADDNGNSGHIRISSCGSKICGVLVNSFDRNGKAFKSENQGRKLIWDMENKGGGNYGGGKVYSPDRDKTYSGKLVLQGNSLNVKGCVLGVCRSGGSWARVK
ncbi:MAG: DUF2147 domain-containing protein [Rhodobacteraceae bacterium]|nr:DUF2147 domain-containing protein [Paracoccaceae bacterium]